MLQLSLPNQITYIPATHVELIKVWEEHFNINMPTVL